MGRSGWTGLVQRTSRQNSLCGTYNYNLQQLLGKPSRLASDDGAMDVVGSVTDQLMSEMIVAMAVSISFGPEHQLKHH